jgi:hypothetical protein
MWIPITPRNCITAHHGQVIISIDYSGEEARIAAKFSGDRNMLGVFRQPSTVIFEGKEYANYYADLHAITAKECVLSKPFEGQPEHLWMSISKDEKNWPGKGSIRDVGKTVNFGIN